jgi:hypothetical protein
MYKLTKQGKTEDGEDRWYMEWIDNDKIQEDIEDSDDVIYLDIPSDEERKKKWEDKLDKILPFLINPNKQNETTV